MSVGPQYVWSALPQAPCHSGQRLIFRGRTQQLGLPRRCSRSPRFAQYLACFDRHNLDQIIPDFPDFAVQMFAVLKRRKQQLMPKIRILVGQGNFFG